MSIISKGKRVHISCCGGTKTPGLNNFRQAQSKYVPRLKTIFFKKSTK